MLRTVNAQPTLWESFLPDMCLRLPAELEAVDRLLDDPTFFAPYRKHFHPFFGRPSVPIETYLRLMFLKSRYKLGFEPLCREVADSISWQRFCHIPLGVSVPHPTTLMKITTRCGSGVIAQLNETLLEKALEAKVLKTDRLRAATTVVEANVAYPSDSGLLAKGVAKMAKLTKRLQQMGFASRTKMADRTRSVRRRARSINANLARRSDDRLVEVRRINTELIAIARRVARDADDVVRNTRRKLANTRSGRAGALVRELAKTAVATRAIAEQSAERIAGNTPPGGRRIVSLHDLDARSIVKGRLGKPVEFGYKAQIVDNSDGLILTTTSRSAIPKTARCSSPPWHASRPGSAAHHGRSPPTAAMAKQVSKRASASSVCVMSCCRRRANRTRPAARSNTAGPSRRWSAGGPDARAGSGVPSGTSGSHEHALTTSKVRGHGAGTACLPTTW